MASKILETAVLVYDTLTSEAWRHELEAEKCEFERQKIAQEAIAAFGAEEWLDALGYRETLYYEGEKLCAKSGIQADTIVRALSELSYALGTTLNVELEGILISFPPDGNCNTALLHKRAKRKSIEEFYASKAERQ